MGRRQSRARGGRRKQARADGRKEERASIEKKSRGRRIARDDGEANFPSVSCGIAAAWRRLPSLAPPPSTPPPSNGETQRLPPAPYTGDTARALEATVKRLAAAGDVDGVQCALQETRLRGVACTEGALAAAIDAFARAGAADRALKTFYRARDLGCSAPTARLYNHPIDALLRENMVAAVAPVYENMKRDGVESNIFTYNLLVKALCQNDRVDVARKMIDEMARKGGSAR